LNSDTIFGFSKPVGGSSIVPHCTYGPDEVTLEQALDLIAAKAAKKAVAKPAAEKKAPASKAAKKAASKKGTAKKAATKKAGAKKTTARKAS